MKIKHTSENRNCSCADCYLKLNISRPKKIVYPVRMEQEVWDKIGKLAKENKTNKNQIVLALIKRSLI